VCRIVRLFCLQHWQIRPKNIHIPCQKGLLSFHNKELKNVLPQVYGKANLDKTSLGELIDLISNTELKAENENSKDLFGRVYEYFLPINGNIFYASSMFGNKLFTHHKHTPATTGRVVNSAFVGLYHFNPMLKAKKADNSTHPKPL
jgi:hypothetical protein